MGAFEQEVADMIRDQFGSLTEFARIANLNPQTVHSLFSKGSFARSRLETVSRIANVLEVDSASLMRGKLVRAEKRFKGYVEVPLYGSISAGKPLEPDEADERFPIPAELAERYAGAYLLRISGTSMNRILPDGCYALVHPCTEVEHTGQPHVVTVGTTDATVKRVYALGNGLELAPDSTDITWHPRIFDFSDDTSEEVRVLGRVVWYCLPLNWHFD